MNDTLETPDTLSRDELRGFLDLFNNVFDIGLATVTVAEQAMKYARHDANAIFDSAICDSLERQIANTRAFFENAARAQAALKARIGQ